MKGNGMKRFNGVVKGLGVPVLFFVVAMVIGIVPVAVAAEPLKVAAVFETPIEEPWVNQIHVALVKAGVYTAQDFGGFSYMSKGGSYLAPYHKFDAKLPAEVKALVEKRKKEILDGTFRVDIDESIPKSE
jgi:hypothetical protein